MHNQNEFTIFDNNAGASLNPLLEERNVHGRIIEIHKQTLLSGHEDKTNADSLLDRSNTTSEIIKPQFNKLLVLSGIFSTLGIAIPSGYNVGVMNNLALHMRRWCNETLIDRFELTLSESAMDLLWSAIISIFLISGAVGALSGAWMANKFGRKPCVLGCGVLLLIAGFCFYMCRPLNSIELLFLGRIIVGLATGLTVSCLPMYLTEIAPLNLLGALGVCCPVGLTTGTLIGQIISLEYVFGSAENWHYALSFYVVFVIPYLILYCYYPESPKWLLVINNDSKTAESELKRLRGSENILLISNELQNIKLEASEYEKSSTFKEVITDPKLKLPLILLCVFHGVQQLSGISAIYNYSVLIFFKAGFSLNSAEWANLGLGTLSFIIVIISPSVMTKCNRRPLMIFSSISCFLTLFAFGFFLYFIENIDWFAIACIVAISLHIIFYQLGVGPIAFFIGSELFEVAPRSVAMSIGSLTNFIACFVACMSFPSLQNSLGPLIFLPLSTAHLIIFSLTYFYLPETRGSISAEVALIVSKGFKSKVRK